MEEIISLREADLRKVKLGRYPFRAGIAYYEARNSPYLSPYTLDKDLRALRAFGKEFQKLKEQGLAKTTDPRHIGKVEIDAFIQSMRQRELKAASREKYLKVLSKYLEMFGNDIITKMSKENPNIFPPIPDEEIDSFDMEELKIIFEYLATKEGWRGAVLRGCSSLSFATGCRPIEIRLGHAADIDLRKMQYYVRRPKGLYAWGKQCTIPIIRGDMVPMIKGFLKERADLLEDKGLVSKYYVFNPRTGEPYTMQGLGRMYGDMSAAIGFPVRLKDFRPTLTSLTIDGDLSLLKATGLQLRHKNLSTTEKYYARIYKDAIVHEIGDRWKDKPVQ